MQLIRHGSANAIHGGKLYLRSHLIVRENPQIFCLYSVLGGARQQARISNRASVATLPTCGSAATSNFAHAEARPSGDFVHGQSPQTSRMCNILGGVRKHHAVEVVHTWPLCPRAAGQQHLSLMLHLYGPPLVS